MASSALGQETYQPELGDQLTRVHELMSAHETTRRGRPETRYLLIGSAPGEKVEIPAGVYQVLRQVVEAMTKNQAVTVSPHARFLSTQQAADLLAVSRPTVVKLLDEQKIPFERVGSHRRILLRDLLAYRERRRDEQYATLEATSSDLGDDQEVDAVLAQLQEARHAVARRRRSDAAR